MGDNSTRIGRIIPTSPHNLFFLQMPITQTFYKLQVQYNKYRDNNAAVITA